MNRYFAAVAALALLSVPTTAQAAPKLAATPALKAGRLVVTVSAPRAFTARTRPRSVSVIAGAATYKLKLRSKAARKTVWRSPALGASQLSALAGTTVRVRIKTRAGTVTLQRGIPAAPTAGTPGAPAPGPAAGTPATPSAPGVTLTRNDDAGRQALAGGDLLLERVESGSVTMTYYRIFLYGSGLFRFEKADWNQVSGEICDSSARREGSWSFAEGYTFAENGGGVVAVIATTVNGQAAREVLVFPSAEPSNVYVGPQGAKFERNPNMRDQC